jgi:ABC-type transport system involved in cytochrome c biogenesis permease component
MPTSIQSASALTNAPGSKARLRTGGILSGLAALFLTFDAVMKFVKPAPVIQAFAQTGWPDRLAVPLGIILLACTALYVIPRTSVLGAMLLTGYLGGAVATHLRIGDPLFSHVLFPVYVGVLLWAGLYLREDRLRALVPLRS